MYVYIYIYIYIWVREGWLKKKMRWKMKMNCLVMNSTSYSSSNDLMIGDSVRSNQVGK